ncbi:hypothetical protein HOLleu_37560 [Holothuria leucospilota]|uniref:Uncharacterized protein n=1 Tax=Holothuria leucospilota TaxID=206669 RepID=A0A9Q1BFD5_HOLLE|nr:hypothetical protein HOLleu_37560 [Holothuria leucospilota]
MRNNIFVIILLSISVICRGNDKRERVNCKLCAPNWSCPANTCPDDGKRSGQGRFSVKETKRDFDNSLSQQDKMAAILKRLMEDYY